MGIFFAASAQVFISVLVAIKFRDFAINVLISSFLTAVFSFLFFFMFNRDAFDLIATVVIFVASLIIGSPIMWLIISVSRKFFFSRHIRKND